MRRILILLPLVFLHVVVHAQDDENILQNQITTAVPFLIISGDPQQMGSGDLGVVSSAMYHSTAFTSNAALLANGQRYIAANTNYTPWLRALVPDINIATQSFATSFHKRHAVGLYHKSFSLGNITFTDANGNTIGNLDPYEFSYQVNYATWFPIGISIGVGLKYVHSNLTGGLTVGGTDTKPGQAFAADLGFNYRKHYQKTDLIGLGYSLGLGFNNLGSKMSYTQTSEKDFIPMNMMVGAQFNLGIKYNNVRFEHDLSYQATKLLVPTPPQFDREPYLDNTLPAGDTLGSIGHVSNQNPTYQQIISGKDPNVSVLEGMFQSFNDAPGGTQEEWNEVTHQVSHEFRFILNDIFMLAIREGFFYEHATKGNRQFMTLGAGIGGAGFRLDLGGYLPLQEHHPLQNTFFIGLSYKMKLGKNKKLMRYPSWSPEQEDLLGAGAVLDEVKEND